MRRRSLDAFQRDGRPERFAVDLDGHDDLFAFDRAFVADLHFVEGDAERDLVAVHRSALDGDVAAGAGHGSGELRSLLFEIVADGDGVAVGAGDLSGPLAGDVGGGRDGGEGGDEKEDTFHTGSIVLEKESVEDHGFAAVAEDAVREMPLHGAGQGDALEVAALGEQVLDVVAVGDAGDVLLDDGAVVQDFGDVVAGGADELDAARECVMSSAPDSSSRRSCSASAAAVESALTGTCRNSTPWKRADLLLM